MDMESLQELIPFAREMLSQKPTRGLLRVYLVGTIFAILGTVIGLVETVCHPFSAGEPVDAEMLALLAREQRTVEAAKLRSLLKEQEEEKEEVEEEKDNAHEEEGTTFAKASPPNQRNTANRLHAS